MMQLTELRAGAKAKDGGFGSKHRELSTFAKTRAVEWILQPGDTILEVGATHITISGYKTLPATLPEVRGLKLGDAPDT